MRREKIWLTVATLSLLVLVLQGAEGSLQDPENLSSFEMDKDQVEDSRNERIFAYYTSTSVTRLVTTTITAISTCVSTVATPVCTGRRRKSSMAGLLDHNEPKMDETDLDSSLEDTLETADLQFQEKREVLKDKRTGRKFTIWSTGYTTLTITSTSALTGTTATVSLLCAIPGVGPSCYLG